MIQVVNCTARPLNFKLTETPDGSATIEITDGEPLHPALQQVVDMLRDAQASGRQWEIEHSGTVIDARADPGCWRHFVPTCENRITIKLLRRKDTQQRPE